MRKNLKISLLPEHLTGDYLSHRDCPLARGIIAKLAPESIEVYGFNCNINGVKYDIGKGYLNGKDVSADFWGAFGSVSVDQMREAVENNKFKSAYVKLTKTKMYV